MTCEFMTILKRETLTHFIHMYALPDGDYSEESFRIIPLPQHAVGTTNEDEIACRVICRNPPLFRRFGRKSVPFDGSSTTVVNVEFGTVVESDFVSRLVIHCVKERF